MASRAYSDPCGIARALDRVGERWSLLVVRELLLGPKRFADLQRGLRDISPNVLTQRLKELEAAGVVRRVTLGPPVGTHVYELTRWGRELDDTLLALARWGSQAPLPRHGSLSNDALVVSLRTTFDGVAAARVTVSANLRLDNDQISLRVKNGELVVSRDRMHDADIDIDTDAATMRGLVYAGRAVDDAIADGQLNLRGRRSTLRQLLRCFTRPERHADAR